MFENIETIRSSILVQIRAGWQVMQRGDSMSKEINYQDYQAAIQFDKRVSRMQAFEPLIQGFIKELQLRESDRVLDIGTGTGRLGLRLHDKVSEGVIVGIDSGRGMLRLARENTLKRGVENFFLVRGAAESLPFLSEIFDSVCLMMSFHHFSSPERATREVYRVLKSQGSLSSLDPVLNEPMDSEDERLNQSIEEAFQEAHGPDFRFFTAAQIQRLYTEAGFSIASCQVSELLFDQKGIEEIPMGPHWNQVRENLWFRQEKALLHKFEQEYFNFQSKGGLLVVKGKARWVIIRAVKR